MRKLAILLPSALLALFLYVHAMPAESPVDAPVAVAPSATPALPPSASEDGAGMALCWWDATLVIPGRSNGKGTSMVSGDCALDITKDERTQSKCINLHHNGQEGIDSVAECNDIENRITEGMDKREEGWTLYDCYAVMNGE